MTPPKFLNNIFEKRLVYLTISTILYLVLPPFIKDLTFLSFLIVVLYTLVLAFCLVIITGHERPKPSHLIFILVLVVPFFRIEDAYFKAGLYLIVGLIYGWAAFKIILQILKIKTVNAQVIMGAVGGYLLIGLAGSFIIAFYSTLVPAAFNLPEVYNSAYKYVYFTFVTFTTLGYGDITPQTPQAQSISILIALLGQVYITILMAILVGKYLFNLNNESVKSD